MNHYDALGVAPDAPVAEIRQAYLRAVLRATGGEGGDGGRQAAVDAWAVLRSPDRRAEYDATLGAGPSSPPSPALERPGPAPLLDDRPTVAPGREAARVHPDAPGLPHGAGDHDDLASRVLSLLPPAVVAVSIAVVLLALLLSSSGLLLVGLLLLVVGLTSFVLIPLYDIVRGR